MGPSLNRDEALKRDDFRFDHYRSLIARSVSDEAIKTSFVTLDCFASLAMTIQSDPIIH